MGLLTTLPESAIVCNTGASLATYSPGGIVITLRFTAGPKACFTVVVCLVMLGYDISRRLRTCSLGLVLGRASISALTIVCCGAVSPSFIQDAAGVVSNTALGML